ncbi:MAG: AAA family ATPase [Candidatus Magasanikbacteria bacterium]
MYVKRIEINGFKSFASHAVLEFVAPHIGRHSITAIVGPNGAGKSNIVDAIRWVLGEQSMKNLRGKKSEDIIFAGSVGKGRMSLASVTMVLDNVDHRAPIEYEELIISRRFYRTGESEYILNENPVRLLDLQILLAQAQFGQGSYSLIGQGTIDRLLLQTPAERKGFFDEAVGIKEFQIKRHHAMLKLTHTKENVTKAQALLQEIEPRLKSLKRQVNKLEKRQEVEISLRDWQEQYYYTQHKKLASTIADIQSQYDELNSVYTELSKQLSSIQHELARLAQEKSRGEMFVELQREYQELVQKKNDFEREYAQLSGKLQTEYTKAGQQNISWLEQKVDELSIQEKDLKQELQRMRNERAGFQSNILTIQQTLDEIQQKRVLLHNERLRLEQQARDIEQGKDLSQIEGLRAVSAILRERDIVAQGAIHGMVAELATVDDTYRLALEVAAQSHLTSIVVENDRVAQTCIEYLKKKELGVGTFLPLNTIKGRLIPNDVRDLEHHDGVCGLATNLVNYNAKFENIFSYVFGSTLVIDSIETARMIGIGRVRMVTLEGDVFEVSGSMKGGYRRKMRGAVSFGHGGRDAQHNSLEHIRERVQKIEQEMMQFERDYENKREQLIQAKTSDSIAEEKLSLLETRMREITQELSGLQQELSLFTLNPEEYKTLKHSLSTDRDTIRVNIDELEKKITGINQKMNRLNAEEDEKRARIFSLQDEMQHKQQEVNTHGDRRHSLQLEIAKLQTHQEDLEQEIFNELKMGVVALYDKKVKILDEQETERAKVEIEKLKYTLSLIGGIDVEVVGEFEETKQRYETLSSELEDLSKASEDLEEMIVELDELMKKKHAQAFKKIKKEFSRYFSLLFEGGEAELAELYGEEKKEDDETALTADSQPVLGSEEAGETETLHVGKKKQQILQGVEVFACPPGKKIKNIAALSGGERTLTSIALLCAILKTNPSPFVILDEVEAALDEANTLRFTKILHELAEQSQFIVITHNRVTMHAADTLYGVTMGNDGMSKLVSVKLDTVNAK